MLNGAAKRTALWVEVGDLVVSATARLPADALTTLARSTWPTTSGAVSVVRARRNAR